LNKELDPFYIANNYFDSNEAGEVAGAVYLDYSNA
jgi:hypothetical protein